MDAVAWLDAKPWHRAAFAAPLVAVIRTVRPAFGRATLGAIDTGADATRLATTFADDLRHVDTALLIVIDDMQALADDELFARFFERAIGLVPPKVRFVLSGRSLPRLAIGELLGRGLAVAIESNIFLFDADDVRALARNMKRTLGNDEARGLATSTSGWATGIALALASSHDGTAGGTASHAAAAAYLNEQLVPTLSDELLAFLENVSVLEMLDVRMLTGQGLFQDAAAGLDRLRRNGALISEIGPGQFRIHPVLRELARTRLTGRHGEVAAHGAAAEAYVRAGEINAALYHVRTAEDASIAASVFRSHADVIVATGDEKRIRATVAIIDRDGGDRDVRAYVEGLLEKAAGGAATRDAFVRASQAAGELGNARLAFAARAEIVEYELRRYRRVPENDIEALMHRASTLGKPAASRAVLLRAWSQTAAFDFAAARDAVTPFAWTGDVQAQSTAGFCSRTHRRRSVSSTPRKQRSMHCCACSRTTTASFSKLPPLSGSRV